MLELVIESWIWFGFTVLVAICRFTSRTLTFGSIRKLEAHDGLMFVALCTYTTFLVTINIVSDHSSNLLEPGIDVGAMSESERAGRIYGSKLILVVEQMQITTIWLVKAGLLIMYYRLTIARRENLFVKALAIYTAFGFVFMEIFYLGVWCRPYSDYWALPTPNKQCNTATNHLITNAVFNLTTDMAMLILGLQMFALSKLPLRRKLVLCGIFGLGTFVILAAVLNKFYSFTQPFGQQWPYWYVRESSTALLVGNLPYTWTLLRRVFKLRAFDPKASQLGSRPRSASNWHTSRTARGRASWSPDARRPKDLEAAIQKSKIEHDPYPLSPPVGRPDPIPLAPPPPVLVLSSSDEKDPYPISPVDSQLSPFLDPPKPSPPHPSTHRHTRSQRSISFKLDDSPPKSPRSTHSRSSGRSSRNMDREGYFAGIRPGSTVPEAEGNSGGVDGMKLNDVGGLAN